MKITGGSLKVREILQSEKNTNAEKVNRIRIYSGEKFTAVEEAVAGTVCAVTGITFTSSVTAWVLRKIREFPYSNCPYLQG